MAAEQPSAGPAAVVAAPAPAAAAAQASRGLLEFLAIVRGERIADLGAGKGYSIERMADAVGPAGVVYARHDPRPLVAAAKRGASAQREGTLPANIALMETQDAAPFSAAARDLDLVTVLFSYHELVEQGQDRLAFNRAVFAALAPDRFYVIAAHAAPAGDSSEAAGAGRVEEQLVRADAEAAGFIFVEAATLLSSTARAGTPPGAAPSSQYVLKFRRP